MEFLNKLAHDIWLVNQLPILQDTFYGSKRGEYISSDTNSKSGDYPIIDTKNPDTNNTIFRSIIKLTHEEIPKRYNFSEVDQEIIQHNVANTFQVVIIQVDDNLNMLNKGHYAMNYNIL